MAIVMEMAIFHVQEGIIFSLGGNICYQFFFSHLKNSFELTDFLLKAGFHTLKTINILASAECS